jgi:hypothetical protein
LLAIEKTLISRTIPAADGITETFEKTLMTEVNLREKVQPAR